MTRTPRDLAMASGSGAKTSGPPPEQDQPAQRQRDNVAGMSERERYLMDKMPPQQHYKPFR